MFHYKRHIGDYRSATAHLTNDEDLAYAKTRLDERSMATALAHPHGYPDPLPKSVVVNVSERKDDVPLITDGLKAGDQVVTAGQVRLSNGSHVKIIEDTLLAKPATTPML